MWVRVDHLPQRWTIELGGDSRAVAGFSRRDLGVCSSPEPPSPHLDRLAHVRAGLSSFI